jgi:hypothetical protein
MAMFRYGLPKSVKVIWFVTLGPPTTFVFFSKLDFDSASRFPYVFEQIFFIRREKFKQNNTVAQSVEIMESYIANIDSCGVSLFNFSKVHPLVLASPHQSTTPSAAIIA